MTATALVTRASILLLLLAAGRALAQPVAPLPVDSALSERCRARPAAFGCANAANLAAMARAGDLVAGRPLAPAPAALEAAAVERLLADKVKDLRREGTGGGNGPGNGPGGGQ